MYIFAASTCFGGLPRAARNFAGISTGFGGFEGRSRAKRGPSRVTLRMPLLVWKRAEVFCGDSLVMMTKPDASVA